jgi:AraC family transcriptional regulator of adaptative response / DNA-3-methyladenine glycosylase II
MAPVTSTTLPPKDELLARFRAKDPADKGAFLVGVLSTGIYCLPTCRARAPRPENVRFFGREGEARAAGLRPCKRCKPDDFHRGFDGERELARRLARELRADPAACADAAALARRAGLGATKLNGLFRHHFHLTPAEFLVRARVARAGRALAEERASVLDAAGTAGFESASAFHENFRARTGLTPAAYRELGRSAAFELALPAGFRVEEMAGYFGRDPDGSTERVRGDVLTKALLLDGEPARVELEFAPERAFVHVHTRRQHAALVRAAHECCVRWLGLASDGEAFVRRAQRTRASAALVRGREGLRIPLATDLFEGLVWVVVGAQVNVSFAAVCRAALIELCGTPVGDGFVAHPTPAAVARLDYADLTRRQYSRRKAEYLIDAARSIAEGALDLEGLRSEPVPLVIERLANVRGLGPWSVQYLCLRAYGFEDCAPIGDVALHEALRRHFELAERPDARAAAELMETFAPHRSLATYHLWKSLG